MSDVPQINDDVILTLRMPSTTEEWAFDLLEPDYDVRRDGNDDLVVTETVSGNCDAIQNARMFLADVEELLREGEVSPMRFSLVATSVKREKL